MNDTLLGYLLSALGMVVFERLPNSSFLQRTPQPSWFAGVFTAAAEGHAITLAQAFPFLESFLSEAEAFWRENRVGVIRSGPFTAQGPDQDYLLTASAVTVAELRVLVFERLTGATDPREMLQRAREIALAHERIAGRLPKAREAAGQLADSARQLAATDLTPAQRSLVESIGRSADRVRDLLREP